MKRVFLLFAAVFASADCAHRLRHHDVPTMDASNHTAPEVRAGAPRVSAHFDASVDREPFAALLGTVTPETAIELNGLPPPRSVTDRPAPPLRDGATIDVVFDVHSTPHGSRSTRHHSLDGVLRIPQFQFSNTMGSSAAPTACSSDGPGTTQSMQVGCFGDLERSTGRVWVSGEYLYVQLYHGPASSDPDPAAAIRFRLPARARVVFHPGAGSLGID